MNDFRITVEGEPTGSDRGRGGGERMPIAEAEGGPDTIEQVRRTHAERARTHNELRHAKVESSTAKMQALDARAEMEQLAARQALEIGNFDDHTARLRSIAAIDRERAEVEAEGRRWQSQPEVPPDPVEAIARERTPESAAWLRVHPEFVLDSRKAAKATAAHNDAIAEGFAPDTRDYFDHVEKFVGLRDGGNGGSRRGHSNGGSSGGDEGSGGTARVTVLKRGEAPAPGTKVVRMKQSEYEAATQHLTWGYDDPHGRFKKNDPIGVREYLRRRQIQDNSPEWQRLDG